MDQNIPKAFRRIMQAKKDGSYTPKNIKSIEAPIETSNKKKKHDSIWNVKEGETFPSYNARIKSAGLSKPPGIPETYRKGEENIGSSNAGGLVMKRKIIDPTISKDDDVEDGLKTKRRRKEFMKNRSKKDINNRNIDDGDDVIEINRKVFKDVVDAPPQIRNKPKNNLKAPPVRKISYDPSVTLNRMGRPSLLPLVKRK